MDTTHFPEIDLKEHRRTYKLFVRGVVLFATLTLITLSVLGYVFL
jgi:hypothetical protein